MAKKQRRKSKSQKKVEKVIEEEVLEEEEEETGEQLTLAKLDAISDEEGGDDDQDVEWNAEARALREAIAEGAFKNLGKIPDETGEAEDATSTSKNGQVQLEEDSSEDDGDDKEDGDNDENQEKSPEEIQQLEAKSNALKALQTITRGLTAQKASLPWAERYDVTPPTPLPFGKKNEEGVYVDVHDDLKREVAFYNLALEASHIGREKCAENNIPFSRPEDFFAEMVKTDGKKKFANYKNGHCTHIVCLYPQPFSLIDLFNQLIVYLPTS
jgi:rRNA-processing protein EBP2